MSLMGDEKTVVIHISRLRKKIEIDSSNPKIIVNVRGIGYKFIPPRVGETHEG
ncbi:DNA-binding response regulator MtrA [compost metagenome]